MNKKGISTWVIVAVVVIIVVVAGIAVYVLYGGGGGEPTPTPTPNPVEGATSMRFDVNATVDGLLEIDRFTAKNLGTSNILLRVDQTDAQGNNFAYLMNQAEETIWADFGTGFTDQSEYFTDSYWNSDLIGNVPLNKYMTALADWSGTGDYEGDSFIIYNIVVDPTIPDSAFEPT